MRLANRFNAYGLAPNRLRMIANERASIRTRRDDYRITAGNRGEGATSFGMTRRVFERRYIPLHIGSGVV